MNNHNKSGKRGCLFLLIGVVLTLLCTAIYALVAGGLSSLVIGSALSGQTAYALLPLSLIGVIIAYFLLNAILFLNYLPTSDAAPTDEISPMLGKRKSAGLSRRTVRWLSVGLLVALIPLAAISAGTYTTVSEEGVSTTICFVKGDTYVWEKVSSYKVACDDGKGLSITFKMRDGKSFEILQNTISAPGSFKSTYPCKEAFAVDILKKMEEHQIPCATFENEREHRQLMESARSFYKGDEALWSHVKAIIRYQEVGVTP